MNTREYLLKALKQNAEISNLKKEKINTYFSENPELNVTIKENQVEKSQINLDTNERNVSLRDLLLEYFPTQTNMVSEILADKRMTEEVKTSLVDYWPLVKKQLDELKGTRITTQSFVKLLLKVVNNDLNGVQKILDNLEQKNNEKDADMTLLTPIKVSSATGKDYTATPQDKQFYENNSFVSSYKKLDPSDILFALYSSDSNIDFWNRTFISFASLYNKKSNQKLNFKEVLPEGSVGDTFKMSIFRSRIKKMENESPRALEKFAMYAEQLMILRNDPNAVNTTPSIATPIGKPSASAQSNPSTPNIVSSLTTNTQTPYLTPSGVPPPTPIPTSPVITAQPTSPVANPSGSGLYRKQFKPSNQDLENVTYLADKKYFLNKNKLEHNNILEIRYSNNRHLIPIKPFSVTNQVKKLILSSIQQRKIDAQLYVKLTESEKYLFRSVLQYLGLSSEGSGLADNFAEQFDVVRGSILAGNDSKILKHKAKAMLLTALQANAINRRDYAQLMLELDV